MLVLDAPSCVAHPVTMQPRRRRSGSVVTIREVAAAAGVSTMTVSRVINHDAQVRAATRDTVRAAMAALNYVPNPDARSLAGAERIRVGLIYGNPSAAYLSEFLLGCLDQAGRGGVGLVVERCAGMDEGAAVRRLIADGVDGVILPPPLGDVAAVHDAIAASGVPAVAVGTSHRERAMSVVAIDDQAAAAAMTTYLVGLGHRRIGFITGDDATSVSAARRQGHVAALAAAGIACDPVLIVAGDFGYRSGLAAADALLHAGDPPTAIFASNDDMAAAVIAAAHRHGRDVPRDLSVAGFDDSSIATTVWPELTTINQPIAAMSRAAVDLLVAAICSARRGIPCLPQRLCLGHRLVVRQSTAPLGD